MWEREGTVRLGHTDAAGVIFFPRLLELAHEGWEAFLDEAGFPLVRGVAGPGPMLPIVHCEADFRRPMRLGDRFRHQLELQREGGGSCAIRHRFLATDGALLAEALVVHAAMDRETGRGVPLTGGMRRVMALLLGNETTDGHR